MKYLIVANWKMNPASQKETGEIFDAVKAGAKNAKNAEVVVCPPFAYLPLLKACLPVGRGLILGAQNCFWEEKGAYTGEISPLMLKDMGVEYVILGHSERRKYFGETDEIINKKIKKALEIGLKVIFCIGETQEQRDAGEKNKILEKQIKIGLAEISNFNPPAGGQISNLIIAYEPVWAIGTGNNCDVQEAKEAINFIKKVAGSKVRALYGGSVNGDNSGQYLKEAGADGLLVGGASLKPEEFIKILKSAE